MEDSGDRLSFHIQGQSQMADPLRENVASCIYSCFSYSILKFGSVSSSILEPGLRVFAPCMMCLFILIHSCICKLKDFHYTSAI